MQKKSTSQIIFTRDFQQSATDELKQGSEVTILFDTNRLPFELALDKKGKPESTTSVCYQFSPDGEVNQIKLAPEKTDKSILKGAITIPTGTNEAIIWFQNTLKTGEVYFDSAFGYNYHFSVITDLVEDSAPVKKSRAKKA